MTSTRKRAFALSAQRCIQLALLFFAAYGCSRLSASDFNQQTAARVVDFLQNQERATDIVNFMHAGADFAGANFAGVQPLLGGGFALGFDYYWNTTSQGHTRVAFMCNSSGYIQQIKVLSTDAILNQPFAIASLSIVVLGNAFLSANKDNFSDDDRQRLKRIVDSADAKKLLEWKLWTSQVVGRW